MCSFDYLYDTPRRKRQTPGKLERQAMLVLFSVRRRKQNCLDDAGQR